MTEEIIIDGVNVAGWTDEEVYYKFEHHTSKAIKQIAFDLYKQLKRLEQENETTNKDLLTERQENAELATENHNLRKALETIREILNVKCSIISNAECVGIINEVLDEEMS